MYHFFVEPHQIGAEEIRIEGADVNHIRNVLRMKPGEEILISSREGGDYFCRVEELEPEYVSAKILEEWENKELPARIYLFQGLPKGDKMELIIQKAVELGAYRVVPVSMKRSVVKLDAKKADAKRKRWNAVSESAAKQSKRSLIPEVAPLMTYKRRSKRQPGTIWFFCHMSRRPASGKRGNCWRRSSRVRISPFSSVRRAVLRTKKSSLPGKTGRRS